MVNKSSLRTKRWRDKQRGKGLCSICTSPVLKGKMMCEEHLSFFAKKVAAKKRDLVKAGWCRQCGVGTPKVVGRTYCQGCLDKKRLAGQMNKALVIKHYGGKCNWPGCQIVDSDMLTLDHVLDDGFKERTKAGWRLTGNAFYFQIVKKKFPEGFQVLCWNHQWKKRIELLRKIQAEKEQPMKAVA